jgi:hypothetical protein
MQDCRARAQRKCVGRVALRIINLTGKSKR